MDSEWQAIARDALGQTSAAERTSVEHFARELLSLVDECRRRLDSPERKRS